MMPERRVLFIEEESVKMAKEKGVHPAEWLKTMRAHGGKGLTHNNQGISAIFHNPDKVPIVLEALKGCCVSAGLKTEVVKVL